jgi:hypothetical protein
LVRYRVHQGMTSLNLHTRRMFASQCRLYQRLLPTYFPRLDGVSCTKLLDLYCPYEGEVQFTELEDMHRAAGLASSCVSDAYGQSTNEARSGLLALLNGKRQRLLDAGKISGNEADRLAQVFYAAESQCL